MHRLLGGREGGRVAVGAGGENHARRGRGFPKVLRDLKKLRPGRKSSSVDGNRRLGFPNIELKIKINEKKNRRAALGL